MIKLRCEKIEIKCLVNSCVHTKVELPSIRSHSNDEETREQRKK